MTRIPPYGLLSLIAFCVSVTATSFTITPELSRFIPACAQRCFISFLAINYKLDKDGNTPTLGFLCSTLGATGFTVGEGAVQCLAAEFTLGACSSFEANASNLNKAYYICNGKRGAIEPTHSTITATVPQAPKTTSLTRTIRSSSTTGQSTLVIDTSSPPSIPSSSSRSTLRTSKVRSNTTPLTATTATSEPPSSSTGASSTSAAATTTTAAGGATNSNDTASSKKLKTGQVVGISIGATAAVGLFLFACLFARIYHKKKKNPNSPRKKTLFSKRQSWDYKIEKNTTSSRTNSWVVTHSSTHLTPVASSAIPPLRPPPPQPEVPPKSYRPTSLRPNAIGLAISPSSQGDPPPQKTPTRRMSKLLPAKPILSLGLTARPQPSRDDGSEPHQTPVKAQSSALPRTSPPPQLPKLQIPSAAAFLAPYPNRHRRDSSATEFEEDGRGSLSPLGQIWRPPGTTPLSATAYYVADGNGNWVLGDSKKVSQLAELEAPASKTAIPASTTKASPPLPQSQTGTLANVNGNVNVNGIRPPPGRRSFSAPTQTTSQLASDPAAPPPLFSNNPNQRRFSNPYRTSSRSLTRPRAPSVSSSITIITDTSEDPPDPSPPAEEHGNLSPVVESPHSQNGRSPVSYPRIPGRDSVGFNGGNQTIRVVPPTSTRLEVPRPSPGLPKSGPWVPISSYNNVQREPNNVNGATNPLANVSINQNANPAQVRTGSPSMRVVDPSPEPDDRGLLPSIRSRAHPSYGSQSQSQPQPYRVNQLAPYPMSQPRQPPQQQPHQQQPRQQPQAQPQQPRLQQQSQQPPVWGLPSDPRPQFQSQPGPRYQRPPQHPPYNYPAFRQRPYQQPQQQYQRPLQQPPQQLQPPHHIHPQQRPAPNRQSHSETPISATSATSLLAKRLGSDRAATMALPTDKRESIRAGWRRGDTLPPGMVTPRQPNSGSLPSTPTWLPTLTPTRRGDDLYLNVR